MRHFLLALLLVVATAGCRTSALTTEFDTTDTAEILRRIESEFGSETVFRGEPAVVRLLEKYGAAPFHDVERSARLALALVRVGRLDEATQLYDALYESCRTEMGSEEFRAIVAQPRAIAYLRLGEQENCIAQHNPSSCVFPLVEAAQHDSPRGSNRAIAALEELLRADPSDLASKWLLNIASMTVGDYPDRVEESWLIRESSYARESTFPAFANRSVDLGVATVGGAGGSIVEDFDGDGQLDVLASSSHPFAGETGRLRLYRNNGRGGFDDVSREAGLESIGGGLNLVQADYDNDGFVDVLVLRGGWHQAYGHWPNTLLRNNGDGTFTDVTVAAGVLALAPSQVAAWGDFDNDGLLDLFVGNETGVPEYRKNRIYDLFFRAVLWGWRVTHSEVQAHLYHNNGDGTFTDIYPNLGVDLLGWIKGASWGDFDNDGRIDLFVSRFAESNVLLRNDGPVEAGWFSSDTGWSFTDVSESSGVSEPVLSFATWFWDYDNDGWHDLFVAGYPYPDISWPGGGLPIELTFSPAAEVSDFLGVPSGTDMGKPRLYRNNRDGTFEDVTRESGLLQTMSPMSGNFGDLDNDGYLDFYLGTGAPGLGYLVPNRMFHNRGGVRFEDVTVAARAGHLQKGHGIAFGDLDNDGDQDLYVVMGGTFPGDVAPNVLLENPGFGNNWVTLRLRGVRSNRWGVGARVELTVAEGDGSRTIHRTIGSGGSFGASSLQLEVGLGAATRITRLRVTWPNSVLSVDEFFDLAVNRTYAVEESGGVHPLPSERSSLGGSAASQ